MVERGELVAQCNVGLLPSGAKKETTLKEFQAEIQTALGKNFGQFSHAAQAANSAGYRQYRVAVTGEVSGLAIQWVYYLLENEQGQRVSLAFTFEEALADRFSKADRQLSSSIRLVSSPSETAAKPTTEKSGRK
jgi:hypothetical protein